MMQSKLIRTSIVKGFSTGLLWLSLGAAYAVADNATPPFQRGTLQLAGAATINVQSHNPGFWEQWNEESG